MRALAPFLPLGLLASALVAVAASTSWAIAPSLADATVTLALPDEEPRKPGYVRPTTLATQVVWDVAAIEGSAAMGRRPRWYVVAYTSGAGVRLRGRPLLSDELKLLPEGALLLEVGVIIDPAWKHVWVAPDGPTGFIPSEFVSELP